MGRDFTIYSVIEGKVAFERHNKTKLKVSVHPNEKASA
jgi:ribosomal protein L27